MDTDIENRLTTRRVTEEGGGGTYGESNMDTHIATGEIGSQWEFAL